MTNEEVILTKEQQDELDDLARQYQEASDMENAAKTRKSSLNSMLKMLMNTYNVNKYVSSDNISLNVSTRPNICFDEDKLLAYCKGLGIDGLVKQKEYVDMEVLESLLYHDKVSKKDIAECKIQKPDIVTLTCKQKKPLNE